MILNCDSDEEYEAALRELSIINYLRRRRPDYHPPIIEDTPWVRVVHAKPEYL